MIKAVVICFLYALFNVSGTTLIKWNLRGRVLTTFNEWLQFLLHFQVIAAFAIIFGSALILFKALSSGAFTFIIPVAVGINFILTVLAGYYIFKDQLNAVSFIGFSLIISGIVLLSINSPKYA
jgi:multidrug transporter EmrE-like cation transporter